MCRVFVFPCVCFPVYLYAFLCFVFPCVFLCVFGCVVVMHVQLIFSNEYTQAEDQNWHLKHFCCFECDCVLAGETYVMEKDKPVCKPCYMSNYSVVCVCVFVCVCIYV